MSNDTSRMLDIRAISQKTGLHERTIRRLMDRDEFPSGVKIGRLRRWHSADVDSWLEGTRSEGATR